MPYVWSLRLDTATAPDRSRSEALGPPRKILENSGKLLHPSTCGNCLIALPFAVGELSTVPSPQGTVVTMYRTWGVRFQRRLFFNRRKGEGVYGN